MLPAYADASAAEECCQHMQTHLQQQQVYPEDVFRCTRRLVSGPIHCICTVIGALGNLGLKKAFLRGTKLSRLAKTLLEDRLSKFCVRFV